MNLDIPFTKNIIFKNKIAEIVSISLEEDATFNDFELLGDFIVSGEFKNLDINVDTNPFNQVIPFKVSLDTDIDINTLKYKIVDFSYEIIDEETLKVDIVLHVDADKKVISEKDEIFENVPDEIKEERIILDEDNIVVDKKENEENLIDEKRDVNNDDIDSAIIENNELENDYITYHVHQVKASETLDVISSIYKISKEDIIKVNDINEVSVGDKILVPYINNEQ